MVMVDMDVVGVVVDVLVDGGGQEKRELYTTDSELPGYASPPVTLVSKLLPLFLASQMQPPQMTSREA